MEYELLTSPIHFIPTKSDILLISFGGMAYRRKTPFEFQRVTQGLPAKHLALRDLRQLWYQAGLPGISDDIWGTIDYLNHFITHHRPNRVITLGSSMGGYAALLFGYYLEVDLSVTFAPKTIIDPIWRLPHGDYWYWRRQLFLLLRRHAAKETWNLRTMFLAAQKSVCCHLFYNPENRVDQLHIQNLEGFANVKFYEISGAGHTLVKTMADQGSLRGIIERAITNSPIYP